MPSMRTANSSPPSRAAVSSSRRAPVSRRATVSRTRSPLAWPRLSLTSLKSSRSMDRTASGRHGCASRRVRANSRRSKNSCRFGSPVSASWKAWVVRSSCSRLRSVMSRTVSTQPWTAESSHRLTRLPSMTSSRPSRWRIRIWSECMSLVDAVNSRASVGWSWGDTRSSSGRPVSSSGDQPRAATAGERKVAVESGSMTATTSVLFRTNASSRRSPVSMTVRSVIPRCRSRWRRMTRRNQTNQPHETTSSTTTRITETARSADRSSAADALPAASVACVSASVSDALPLSVHCEVRVRSWSASGTPLSANARISRATGAGSSPGCHPARATLARAWARDRSWAGSSRWKSQVRNMNSTTSTQAVTSAVARIRRWAGLPRCLAPTMPPPARVESSWPCGRPTMVTQSRGARPRNGRSRVRPGPVDLRGSGGAERGDQRRGVGMAVGAMQDD